MTTTFAPLTFLRMTFFFSFFGFFTLNLIATHGLYNGIHIAAIGWTFYVMCLPFFGGGIVLYPLMPIVGALPHYAWELGAWLVSIAIHMLTSTLRPHVYHLTMVTHFLSWSLQRPIPYWLIFICAFLPLIPSWLYATGRWPYRTSWYMLLQLLLMMLGIAVLGSIGIHDLIILSNIHG